MIPPTLGAVVLAVAASLSHPHVPDRAPHAVTETRQTAIRPSTVALHGLSTWYRYVDGQAAAGPALRAFLGKDWRGMTVTEREVERYRAESLGKAGRHRR